MSGTMPGVSPCGAKEPARMAAVHRYDVLDTPPDGAFDRVAALAARFFDAPVATVTIVDSDRIWFKAAHGLEGVSEIGRDPGLCASAILSDGPTVIPDALADPTACSNPLVAGPMGIRFYAAAPIVTADGHRLGTVNVLDTRPREITEDDTATLVDLAAIVLSELELRLAALRVVRAEQGRRHEQEEARLQAEHDQVAVAAFASTLQRTLLPPALPAVPGLELACHYATASPRDVGGDFYDVFPLGGERWAFFLGDVCGKGAEAAAVTSLTRYTLRAAAQHHTDPAAVLADLNGELLRDETVEGRFCTCVFGLLQPCEDGGFQVSAATGGHPPLLHVRPGGGGSGARTEAIRADGGMLVGAFPEADFTSSTFRLRPGEGLLLYTDGLTEARLADGTMLGEDGLTAFLSRRPSLAAAALVDDTVALLHDLPNAVDDVALLALSVPREDVPRAPAATGSAHTAAAPVTHDGTTDGSAIR